MLPFSLKTKMTLAVFLLVVGIAFLVGALALQHFERTLKETISHQQFALVRTVAADLDAELARTRQLIIDTAATIPTDLLGDADRLQEFLDQRLGLAGTALFDNGIFLFAADGKMIAEFPFKPGRRGRVYSFRDYFRTTVASGQPQISDPYFSSQTHRHPAVNFTAPVRDRQGRLVAVIAGSVDLTRENFLGGLSRTMIGRSGYLYLYNTQRLMIMHPDPTRILQKDVPPGANILFDRAIEGFEGTGETVNSRGIAMLASFKRLQTTDWIMASTFPLEEAYTPVLRARKIFVLGLAVVLLLSTVTVWLFMGYLTAPLRLFLRHIRDLSKNEGVRLPLPVRTHDEIGALAESFNDLMTEVEKQKRITREQLSFLQTMIETIPAPLYYKDTEGRYLGCNRAFEKVHGRTRQEMIGRTIHDFSSPEWAAEIAAEDDELFMGMGKDFQVVEKSIPYADGTMHMVIFYKDVFRHDDNTPAGLVGTIIDISERKGVELALEEQREFSHNLLQNSAAPCFVIDLHHRVLIWNRACEELTGIAAAEVVGTDLHWKAFYLDQRPCLSDLVIDEDLERTLDLYDSFADSPLIPDGVQAQGWFPNIGGKLRFLLFEAAPIRDSNGKITAAIETLHDLTGLKRAEQALRESEESYRSIIERSPDAIIVHREGSIVFVNQGAARLFAAQSMAEMAGRRVLDLIHPDSRRTVEGRFTEVETRQVEKPYAEEKILRLDGTSVEVEAGSTPVFYGGKWGVQTILRDITDRKEIQERIWRQANFDTLTGIPNRPMFHDRLQSAINQAERGDYHVALFFIDLDRFKEINDRLGHEAGDALLRSAAQRLSGLLRKTDTLARMGGDEFTIIMPRVTEPPAVSGVAQRILQTLSEPFLLPAGEGQISASIGIAFYPEDGADIATLMKHADMAMYRAKESGRSTFTFYSAGRIIRDLPEPVKEEEEPRGFAGSHI